jgi:hypothetical protein
MILSFVEEVVDGFLTEKSTFCHLEGIMDRDPKALFQEAWDAAARRINAGKRSKDKIRFFLTDGTVKTFDIPSVQDDGTKDTFFGITLQAINRHPVEALMLNHEVWFLEDDKITELNVDEYLKNNPRPTNHPKRKEGVSFYYEAADGTIFTAISEIVINKKNKRELAELSELKLVKSIGRMTHFFQKARDYSEMNRSMIDDIIRRN